MMSALAILLAAAVRATLGYTPPPMYNITATSLYDAGLQHGKLASSRIRGWLGTAEMQGIIKFVASPAGAAAFARMKRANTAAFPALVRELEGIASGAQVALDEIWVATLINELESLMDNGGGSWPPRFDDGHCTDVYAVAEGGALRNGAAQPSL